MRVRVRLRLGLELGLRLRLRLRLSGRVRGWVGSTSVPRSDQRFLARRREQPTAPNIRAANLLGKLVYPAPSRQHRRQ